MKASSKGLGAKVRVIYIYIYISETHEFLDEIARCFW